MTRFYRNANRCPVEKLGLEVVAGRRLFFFIFLIIFIVRWSRLEKEKEQALRPCERSA
jgi:hypothetical protein